MDEFAEKLKDDAASIEAQVSAQLRARIEASLHATEREVIHSARAGRQSSFWWASSLTGVAAAAVVIALLNRNVTDQPLIEQALAPPEAAVLTVVPEYVRQLGTDFSLRAENAVFTEPLEDELEKLKADIEKARKNVRRDLRSAF